MTKNTKDSAKKTAAEKPASKTSTKKTAVKKTAVKKVAAKKAAAVKKPAAKKTAAKKTAVGKVAAAKKAPAKKTAVKKTAAKKSTAKKLEAADPVLDIVKKCYQALDDKKAEDLKVLDVRGKSPITNYFLLATANSEPHLRALSNELLATLKELGVKSVGREFNEGSGWVVVDAFDFMVHIFLPEQRGLYGIEALWKDADRIM